jgi:hypothetical protein
MKALLAAARDFARLPEAERAKPEARARARQLVSAFVEWEKRADAWARSEGHKYGIGPVESPEATGGAEPGPPK